MVSANYTRSLLDATPEYSIFYQKWRHRKSDFQTQLIKIEKKCQQKLIQLGLANDVSSATYIHAVLHGLMTAAFLSPKEFESANIS
ncbi:MAG: hypothetical protein ACK5P7_08905 [Bdellovibrio sp.]